MPRQNSGSRSQQDQRGKHKHMLSNTNIYTHFNKQYYNTRSYSLPLQFVLLPLSAWSPCTLRFPVSHPIGCSLAGSGSTRKYMPVSVAMTRQQVGAWWSSATWASAKQPSLPDWWRSVVMETECGLLLLRARALQSVSRDIYNISETMI